MSLERFHQAQTEDYAQALREVRSGRKVSHWMWYIFPQLRGLGRSATALHYGIEDMSEAREFLADPVLGARLREISAAMLAHDGQSPEDILGPVDALKLRSSATLFEAAGGGEVFAALLDTFYDGERCPATLELLRVGH